MITVMKTRQDLLPPTDRPGAVYEGPQMNLLTVAALSEEMSVVDFNHL